MKQLEWPHGVARLLALLLGVTLLASCGGSSRDLRTSLDAPADPERRQLKMPSGNTDALLTAAVSARSALIVEDVVGDPTAEIAAAGILDVDGSMRPVEPLPALHGATAVSLTRFPISVQLETAGWSRSSGTRPTPSDRRTVHWSFTALLLDTDHGFGLVDLS